MSSLPPHLDYEEVSDADDDHPATDWWPLVRCTRLGCGWTYDAAWSELDPDPAYGTDWSTLHSPHA